MNHSHYKSDKKIWWACSQQKVKKERTKLTDRSWNEDTHTHTPPSLFNSHIKQECHLKCPWLKIKMACTIWSIVVFDKWGMQISLLNCVFWVLNGQFSLIWCLPCFPCNQKRDTLTKFDVLSLFHSLIDLYNVSSCKGTAL